MANKIYLYQDLSFMENYWYVDIQGRTVYFENAEMTNNGDAIYYYTTGPYSIPNNYSSTYVQLPYKDESNMEYPLGAYYNGEHLYYSSDSGNNGSFNIYYLENDGDSEDSGEEYIVADFYVDGWGMQSYNGPTYDSFVNGRTYYVKFCPQSEMTYTLLGSFTYSSGQSLYTVGGISFELGEGYCWKEGEGGNVVVYYKEDNNYGTLSVTLSNKGIASIVYTPSKSTYIDYYYYQLYSESGMPLSGDAEYLMETISSTKTYTRDFTDHMSVGERYYCKVDFYSRVDDDSVRIATATSSTITYETDTPSSSVTASILLNPTTGVATWSYSGDVSFHEPMVTLWDLYDAITTQYPTEGYYDFSVYMSEGNQYYATLQVEYYDYSNDFHGYVDERSEVIIYSPISPDEPDPEPPSSSKSFNGLMTAIANAVRTKASKSGSLSLTEMIDQLNALNSVTGKSEGSYDKTNFDVCMSQLAKVIRTKGGTTAKLTLEKMPAAIAAIQLAPSTNYQWLLYDSQWGKYDLNNLPDYIGAPHYNGNCAYCDTTLYFYNSYFYEYCPECNAYLLFMDGGTSLIDPPSGDDGWQYNELWYYMGDWHTQNPAEGATWYAITCSKCGATCYCDSVGAASSCANVDSVGNTCDNWLSWTTEGETYGVCHVSLEYLGNYCGQEGPYENGCPIHGWENWVPRDY